MLKKLTFLFFVIILLQTFESNAQYVTNKVPHYLRAEYEELYINHPGKINPLIKKVRWAPIPPEWAKYKPEQTRIQNTTGFDLINITNGNDAQSETWIAINPKNPQNIIATANDNKYLGGYQGYKMNSWYTLDGGNTWTSSPTPTNMGVYIDKPSAGSMTIFDPGIAFDTEGRVVYTYGFCQILGSTTDGDNGVFAVASTNGGVSWDAWGPDLPISAIALSTNESTHPFHDRYTLACDNVSNSEYKNRFYVTWQRFISNPGIAFSYSDDYGQNWSNPIILGSGSTQAPMPAIGPNGEVYVAWINSVYPDESQAIVTKSTNGGKSWGNAFVAQKVYSIGTRNQSSGRFVLADKQGMRVSSPPQIAVDASASTYKGNVYVVQSGRETSGGLYGIWVSKSTNGGSTWKKVRVDDSQVRNDMFFPSITVDSKTGMVSVLYYSSQNDPTNNQGIDAYLSFSKDGGDTWSVMRLTPSTFYINSADDVMPQGEAGNVYWGDYTSITSYNGVIYPLFWMPTASSGSYFSLDLFTAPISSKPAPVKDLTADNIINGSKINIKLTWTNPTIDLLNNPLGDFNVLVYRNDVPGNPIATINKSQKPEYTDLNVTDGITYTYNFKVVTTDARESTIASISILAGGALKPNPPSNVTWLPENEAVKISWTNPNKAIDGNSIRELSKINIYINGALFKSIDENQSQAGLDASVTIPLTSGTFAKMKITAVASRDDKTAESDPSHEFVIYAGQLYSTFSENFDGATITPHFSEKGWVTTTEKAFTAPNSLATTPGAKYETNTNYSLYLPPLVVTAENQSLIFEHICLVHSTDFAEVSVSKDWGNTFKGRNWYDVSSSPNFIKGDLAGSNWVEAGVDLRPFIGDTIMIKFTLYSGAALTDLGWFIDDLKTDNRVGIEEKPKISENSLKISPNPANSYANIEFNLLSESSVKIELIDLLGNLVKQIDLGNVAMFNSNVELDLTSMPNGTYYVKLSAGNSQIVRPLQITR